MPRDAQRATAPSHRCPRPRDADPPERRAVKVIRTGTPAAAAPGRSCNDSSAASERGSRPRWGLAAGNGFHGGPNRFVHNLPAWLAADTRPRTASRQRLLVLVRSAALGSVTRPPGSPARARLRRAVHDPRRTILRQLDRVGIRRHAYVQRVLRHVVEVRQVWAVARHPPPRPGAGPASAQAHQRGSHADQEPRDDAHSQRLAPSFLHPIHPAGHPPTGKAHPSPAYHTSFTSPA